MIPANNNERHHIRGRYNIKFLIPILLVLAGMVGIVWFAVTIFIDAFRHEKDSKPYYKAWDILCEENYEEAIEEFEKYKKKSNSSSSDADLSIKFCQICIYYRNKMYYEAMMNLNQLDSRTKGEKTPYFNTAKHRNFYNSKLKEIRSYIDAHGSEIRRQNLSEQLDQAARKRELEKRQKIADEEYIHELKKQPYPKKGMTEAELETTCLGKATNRGRSRLTFKDAKGNETSNFVEGICYSFEFRNDKGRKVYAYVEDGKVIFIYEEPIEKVKDTSPSYYNYPSKKKNKKTKDQMDYDIDTYYNDHKNSDSFVDEDDAWDDFEDNDGWGDY